jgi:predicted nucleic-acid-binding Zn-ribbon protein
VTPDQKCPKCNGERESGFLRDRIGGASRPVQWIAGVPEKSELTGGAKIRKRARYQVEVMRCKECGYLEQYATKRLAPAGLLQND